MDTPENKATGKVTPLINRNWHRAPASTSAAAEHGSPSARYVVDDEDTEGDDWNSDDGKLLVIPYFQLIVPCLHPIPCRDCFIMLYFKFFQVPVTCLANLGFALPKHSSRASPPSKQNSFFTFCLLLVMFICLKSSLPSFLLLSCHIFLVDKPVLNFQFHEDSCCPKAQ